MGESLDPRGRRRATTAGMAASPDTHRRTWSAVLDGPLNELAEGDRQQRHLSRSDFVRLAIATFIGDPALATISKGRPKKD